MTDGYRALRESAALLDLTARARIYCSGDDRARLLHALTTNHVQQLRPGQGCYAFFLNAQGRILADVNILCLEDRLLLDLEPEARQLILAHLDHYIIADDVTPDDATDRTVCLAVEGPGAAALLTRAGVPLPDVPQSFVLWNAALVAMLTATGAPGFRIFADREKRAEIESQLHAAGAIDASPDDMRTVRIEHFLPRYGDDIRPTTLPQETQLARALHFSKGCYLGQEIVERIRSRGHVNRVLVGFEAESPTAPPAGTKAFVEGHKVGEVTSALFSPAVNQAVGIALILVPSSKPGTIVDIDGPATIRALAT